MPSESKKKSVTPSSNWLQLKRVGDALLFCSKLIHILQTLSSHPSKHTRKRRKLDHSTSSIAFEDHIESIPVEVNAEPDAHGRESESKTALRTMIAGKLSYTESQKLYVRPSCYSLSNLTSFVDQVNI